MPGAGAVEIELAQSLLEYADTLPGLEQYAVRKFAVALEAIPRALADNSGANTTEVINNIYKAHKVLYNTFVYLCQSIDGFHALAQACTDVPGPWICWPVPADTYEISGGGTADFCNAIGPLTLATNFQ